MASTAARAALARATELLSARDRNVLTMHGRYGIDAVMDFLRVDRVGAEAELGRIREKLQPLVQRELRKPPELPSTSSLRPPEGPPSRPAAPLLRSAGQISANTPASKRRRGDYKPKACKDCGREFKPQAPRQVKCDECRGVAPMTVRHVDPQPVGGGSVSVPTEPRPVEEAALAAAGIEAPSRNGHSEPAAAPAPASSNGKRKRPAGSTEGLPEEYVSLRDELTAIQMRLHSFAGRLDRLMENVQINREGVK